MRKYYRIQQVFWKFLFVFSLLFSFHANVWGQSAGKETADEAGYATDRVLVVFEENVTEKEEKELLENTADSETAQKVGEGIWTVELIEDVTVEEAIDSLEEEKGIASVSPDYRQTYYGYTNDPEISSSKYAANQHKYHYIFKMGLADPGLTAWNYATGKNVKVAVLDSGANTNHRELSGNIKGCYNAVEKKEGAAYVKDNHGHGSMTAGILAAAGNNGFQAAGAACEADLYIVKTDDEDGYVYSSYVIEGIRWAVAQGCRVISISTGGETWESAYAEAIRTAYENNVVVVCSGGNSGTGEYHYPAAYDGAIGVSALNYSPTSGYTIMSSSTWNDQIDLAAPGSGLYGVSRTDNTSLAAGGATSAAAPYVAGVAALVLQANPSLTANQCREILTQTAVDAGSPGYDTRYGYGIIDPLAAVQRAKYNVTSISRQITGVAAAYTKEIGTGSFQLTPSVIGSGVLSYQSGNPSVAVVSNGRVDLKSAGRTTITISIGRSGIYQAASVKTVLTVTPGKQKAPAKAYLKKPKTGSISGKKTLTVRWKKVSDATGYQVVIAKDKNFKKGKKIANIKSKKTIKKTFKKMAKGKWFMKVRAYKTISGRKLYGPYSDVISKKIK